jgi:hypothetical protein
MMGSSRTIGVPRLGGNAGTNRDPAAFAAERKAEWARLTGGRVVETMSPGRLRMGKVKASIPWQQSNLFYMRNPKRVRGAK